MKIEFESSDIEAIAQRVLELLKPYLVLHETRKETREETKDSENPERVYLDSKQLAGYLGLSVATIRSWTYQQKIPYVKFGRRVLFKRSEMERWAQSKG